MKIAISSDGTELDSRVSHKFGTSRYLIILDLKSGDFEVVSNPGLSGQQERVESCDSVLCTTQGSILQKWQ